MEKTERLKILEARAFDAGLSMKEICKRAGVAQSTVSRWRANPDAMTGGPYRRLMAAIEAEGASQ
jgi:transcriptional regulator with XRE-family HTH domain